MRPIKLNASTYLFEGFVEGYSSCIWTERYSSPGDFEIKSPFIKQTLDKLPLGTLLSLADTDEIMEVEDHLIEEDEETGEVEITVTGRSLTNILENRTTNGVPFNKSLYPDNWTTPWALTLGGYAASAFLWNHLVNPTNLFMAAREDTNGDPITTPGSPYSILPNLLVSDNVFGDAAAPTGPWPVSITSLDVAVWDALAASNYGLRTVRPSASYNTDRSWRIISFDNANPPNRFVTTLYNNASNVIFEVYRGSQTNLQFLEDSVGNSKYLFSNKNYKNIALVNSSDGQIEVAADGVWSSVSGKDRKVMNVDAGDVSEIDPSTLGDFLIKKGKEALRENNQVKLFNGEISDFMKHRYRLDYGLGDTLTIPGKYGLTTSLKIAEYVRIEDSEGDRAYPTFSLTQ